jgi:hypothetical protein
MEKSVRRTHIDIAIKIENHTSKQQRHKNDDPNLDQHPELKATFNGVIKESFSFVFFLGGHDTPQRLVISHWTLVIGAIHVQCYHVHIGFIISLNDLLFSPNT